MCLACFRNSRIPTKNKLGNFGIPAKNKLGILEFLLKLRIKNDKFKTD